MNKDFTLITGHGIFPSSSILQVVPVTDIEFLVEAQAPETHGNEFVFSVIKSVSVNLDITRTNLVKSKKDKDAEDYITVTDYGYTKNLRDEFEFSEAEFIKMLDLRENEEFKRGLKDYSRRLKKITDYESAVAVIESNPQLADYASSLDAIKINAPSESTSNKQIKSLSKLVAAAQEALNIIVETVADDDDSTEDETVIGSEIMSILNSEDSQDAIEQSATNALRSFYLSNFSEEDDLLDDEELQDEDPCDNFFETEDGIYNMDTGQLKTAYLDTEINMPPLEDRQKMVEDAILEARTIRQSPNTIVNE